MEKTHYENCDIMAAKPYLVLSGDKGLEVFKDEHREGEWKL
jgi:hypothetical protein